MLNNIKINGSRETTFFDFTFSTSGMVLNISPGSYIRNNQTLFQDAVGGSITIPTTENMNYDICLLDNGITVFQYTDADAVVSFYQSNNVIDTLAWFTIPPNTTSLDNVQINVKEMVMGNAN